MNDHIFDSSCWCAPVVDGNVVKHDATATPPTQLTDL